MWDKHNFNTSYGVFIVDIVDNMNIIVVHIFIHMMQIRSIVSMELNCSIITISNSRCTINLSAMDTQKCCICNIMQWMME